MLINYSKIAQNVIRKCSKDVQNALDAQKYQKMFRKCSENAHKVF